MATAILKGPDFTQLEPVEVPEWGVTVYVRDIGGGARGKWEAMQLQLMQGNNGELENLRARLCVLTVCDAEGNLVFVDGDIEALSRKSASALERIAKVSMRISKLRPQDAGETEGNS